MQSRRKKKLPAHALRATHCTDRTITSTTVSGRPSSVDPLGVRANGTRTKRCGRKSTKKSTNIHLFTYGIRTRSRFALHYNWYVTAKTGLLRPTQALARLGAQSRFGDELLGIRVRNMFLYSAVPTRYLTRLVPQSRLGDTLLGTKVGYMFLYNCSAPLTRYLSC